MSNKEREYKKNDNNKKSTDINFNINRIYF